MKENFINYDSTYKQLTNIADGLIELNDENSAFVICHITKKDKNLNTYHILVNGSEEQLKQVIYQTMIEDETFANVITICSMEYQFDKLDKELSSKLKKFLSESNDKEHD